MASKPKSGPQDLPPKGGYNPIQTSRVAIRRIISPTLSTGLFVGTTMLGFVGYYSTYRNVERNRIETTSAQLAVLPLLLAQRDREFLKQLRRNRDEEAKLMEDYPGWVVGTYFGEPIYKGEPKDKLFEPTFHEYVAFASPKDTAERYHRYALT
ncbi:hypothetical protein PV327_006645 [Microctonus hyperodae]|uniref:NADH dehydrogenase [ubiquinone] 1 alpha subcomplex subunit 13 n=1 Tax=Microctonus hyperodae TaxID=165561 RepID=A0AA39F4P8_MICHY|nr:hypothetical protein PV327_006645 [Microctonus hyperodae]